MAYVHRFGTLVVITLVVCGTGYDAFRRLHKHKMPVETKRKFPMPFVQQNVNILMDNSVLYVCVCARAGVCALKYSFNFLVILDAFTNYEKRLLTSLRLSVRPSFLLSACLSVHMEDSSWN